MDLDLDKIAKDHPESGSAAIRLYLFVNVPWSSLLALSDDFIIDVNFAESDFPA